MATIRFKARPWKPHAEGGAWCFVTLPAKVHKALGGAKGRIPIVVAVGTHEFRTSAMPYDAEHHFMFNATMRSATGKEAGDLISFAIALDTAERKVEVPKDLQRALRADPAARKAFEKLAYSHQKEYVEAINEAKRPETRARRIAGCIEMVTRPKLK